MAYREREEEEVEEGMEKTTWLPGYRQHPVGLVWSGDYNVCLII